MKRYRHPWIKLWCENLLFGTTSKELEPAERWVFVAYLAMAGSSPEPGKLVVAPGIPYSVEQRAKITNVNLELLQSAERKMLESGKIKFNGDTVSITNFDQYQAKFDRSAYMSEYMKHRREAASTQPSLPESIPKEEPEPNPVVMSLSQNYEKEIGIISPSISAELLDFAHFFSEKNCPVKWIEEAFTEAAKNNKRNWAYVKAILKSWIEQGKRVEKPGNHGPGSRGRQLSTDEEIEQSLKFKTGG